MGNTPTVDDKDGFLAQTTLFPDQAQHLQKVFTTLREPGSQVIESRFQRYLELPEHLSSFAHRLFIVVCQLDTPQSTLIPTTFSYRQLARLLEIFKPNNTELSRSHQILFTMYSTNGTISKATFREMLNDCASLSQMNILLDKNQKRTGFPCPLNIDDFKKIISVLTNSANTFSPFPQNPKQFSDWMQNHIPSITKAVEYWLWFQFLREDIHEGNQTITHQHTTAPQVPLWPPMITYLNTKAVSHLPSPHAIAWLLAATKEYTQGNGNVLYSTGHHGISINQLWTQAHGYNASTFLLVQTEANEIFGAYLTIPWDFRNGYQEDTGSYLFSIVPEFTVCRGPVLSFIILFNDFLFLSSSKVIFEAFARGNEDNHLYFNNSSSGRTPLPVGIGFGGSLQNFRLFLDKELQQGTSSNCCSSYQRGKIVASPKFDVRCVELWGCGGPAALEAQKQSQYSSSNSKSKKGRINGAGWQESSSADRILMDLAGITVPLVASQFKSVNLRVPIAYNLFLYSIAVDIDGQNAAVLERYQEKRKEESSDDGVIG